MCWFHKWIPVGTKCYKEMSNGKTYRELTIVLYHCEKCNRIKTIEIDGNWTLDECKGIRQTD